MPPVSDLLPAIRILHPAGGRSAAAPMASTPANRIPVGGFTLLEVMIAMAILAIALVAVYQSQSQSISMSGGSHFLTTASLLAQNRMAVIDAADPREVAAGNGDFGDTFPDYRWQVEIGDTEVDLLKKITLTVTNSRMAVRNTYRLILYKVIP